MNRSGVIVITLLAVAAIVFAALYFTGNSDKANITGNLNDQIASLKADAAKAAKEASAELEAVKAEMPRRRAFRRRSALTSFIFCTTSNSLARPEMP